MRKLLIAVVVLVVLIGGVLAYALANLNAYLEENKEWIEAQVESTLGREVRFEAVTVSLGWGLAARVTKLRVADDPDFSKEDFVRAGDVRVSVRLWPALFGRYEVEQILLEEPSLIVIREAQGFNFDSIAKSAAEAEAPPQGEPPAGEEPSPRATAAFLVAQTEVRNASLRYVDRTQKPATDLLVRRLDFSASDVSLDSPISLEMAAALFGAGEQNMQLSGTIGPLGSPSDVQKAPLDFRLKVGPLAVDQLKKAALVADAIPPQLASPDPLSAEVSLAGTAGEPKVKTSFDATSAAVRYGSTFVKPAGIRLALEADASRSGETLNLASLQLRLADLELSGSGTVHTGEQTRVALKIDSNRAPLSGWDRLLPALAGHEVSGQFETHLQIKGPLGGEAVPALSGLLALHDVNARLEGSPHQIEGLTTKVDFREDVVVIPPSKFRLGGSPVEFEARVDSLKARRGTFALRSEGLRAASLGIAGEGVKKEEVIHGLDLSGSFQAPADNSLLFQGKLRSENGSLRDIDYQKLRADFGLREQVATLDTLALEAFGGTYDGGGRYDLRDPERPKFDFRSTLRGMALKRLLAAQFPGGGEQIEGRLDADLKLAGSGKEWETIREKLVGDGRVDVKDGVINDVNIAEQVLTGVTGIPGLANLVSPRVREKYPELFATGDTKFDKLGGRVEVANGAATTNDLTLSARDYTMLGQGTFHLDNQLDFTATFVASEKLTLDIVEDVKEAEYLRNEQDRLAIPFRLTGSLPNVKPRPDIDSIAKAVGRAAIEKGVKKGIDKLLGGKKREGKGETEEDSGRELFKKGLEGLFGR